MKTNQVWSVTDLNRWIKHVLERDERLGDLWVRGEISNFMHHSSGHMYFTLKDKDSRIKVVMFASSNRFLKFIPRDGTKAIVRGSISAFERDGAYQLYAREMQPDGLGSLYLAFEQLKEKLAGEGLFAPERKRPLPQFPKKVGVVTSPTGAAIRDICSTIKRRYPQAEIIVSPAMVQGTEAPSSIVKAIQIINRQQDIDVLIVGRGGGSIEELWAFNDEKVARAIANSRIPVISAVGHETDYTIADFVADVRAATPTAAAELAVPHYLEWVERTKQLETRLQRAIHGKLNEQRNRLERMLRSYAMRRPHKRMEEAAQRLDGSVIKLHHVMSQLIARRREQVTRFAQQVMRYRLVDKHNQQRERLTRMQVQMQQCMNRNLTQAKMEWSGRVAQLDALSPLKVMQRGFSLVYKNEELVTSVERFAVGDKLVIRLSDGNIAANVEQIEREEKRNGSQENGTRSGNTV